MTKAQILKQTGLTEQEFYKLYPTQQHYQMAMGGRLYANGGGLPTDGSTSYVQYDEAGNPITANQMYGNKQVDIPGITSSTTNWTQQDENKKLDELVDLKRKRDAVVYNLNSTNNETTKGRLKDELLYLEDEIQHWETYGVPKEASTGKQVTQKEEKSNSNSFDSMSFNSAFGEARKQGMTTFKWKGKSYGTKLKGETTKSNVKSTPAVTSELEGAPKRMALGGKLQNGVVDPLEKYVQMYGHKYKGGYNPSDKRFTTGEAWTDDQFNDAFKKHNLSYEDGRKVWNAIQNPGTKIQYNNIPLEGETDIWNDNRTVQQQSEDWYFDNPKYKLTKNLQPNPQFNPKNRDENEMALGGVVEPVPPTSSLPYKPSIKARTDKQGRVLPSNIDAMSPQERLQASMTREHQKVNQYGGGGDIERPRPVVHTGTANNKSWVQSGLDYIGNLGVQDFSNNIQDIFFNPNKGVILDRNNPNISSIIPAVKNYNSSNIKPSYTQQYADGGNLAGNMGMTGVQNNDVKANNKYFTDAEAALAAFAENMPIVGSIVKAQNNRLSGAREQIDRKGGIGAGIGQAFSQAVDMGLGLVGGMKGNKRENTTESSLSKNADTLQSPSNINETLMNPVEGDTNVLGTLPNNAYGGRLNYGFGGSTDGRTPQYTKTAASALSHNPYMSNVSPVIAGGAGSVNRVGQASNNILGQASPIHKSNTGAYYTDKNINVNSYTKAAGGAITEINTGGTHEQNPMGGVMVGRNASVEQGEALINKDGKPAFVLTDRIKLDSTTAEEFGLPKKYIGKTFSDIGKAENRVSDLRPNDPLTKDLLKSRNEKLEAAQEAQKARMAEKHMAKAQELAPEMFQQAQPQGMPQEQMAMQDPAMEQQMIAMQGQGMPQGMPQQPMMASGGSLNFKSSGAYNKWLGYVHANKLAENTPGHQKVSIGGEPHRVQHGYGGVMQYPLGGPFDFSKAIKSAEMLYNMRPENNMSDQEVILPDDYRDPYLPVQGNLKEYPNTIVTLDTNISPNIPDIKRNVYGKIRGFEGVPPVFGENPPVDNSGYYTREISNIPLPSDKYDKASLAMLGMNAIANLGAAANMRGPRTSGSVNFDRINTYGAEQAARMAANDAIANTRDAARNAGASQAQYLGSMPGNIAQASATAAGEINNIKLRGQQANANIQMQEAMQNKKIEMEMKQLQDMSDAQKVNQISKISGKTVESVNEVMKGMSARERDLYTLQWMNQKNYGIATAEDAKKYGVKEGSYFYHAPKTDYTKVYDSQKGEWVVKVAYGGKISKKFGGKIKNC